MWSKRKRAESATLYETRPSGFHALIRQIQSWKLYGEWTVASWERSISSAVGSFMKHGSFPLEVKNELPNSELRLQLMLWFRPAKLEPSWGKIISSGEYGGLRSASFLLRPNFHVEFYQDTHHFNTFRPPSSLCGTPRRIWGGHIQGHRRRNASDLHRRMVSQSKHGSGSKFRFRHSGITRGDHRGVVEAVGGERRDHDHYALERRDIPATNQEQGDNGNPRDEDTFA